MELLESTGFMGCVLTFVAQKLPLKRLFLSQGLGEEFPIVAAVGMEGLVGEGLADRAPFGNHLFCGLGETRLTEALVEIVYGLL